MLKDKLNPDWIHQQTGLPVYFTPESQSTQEDARTGITKNNPSPALYLAENQIQAVGRFGRPFYTQPNGGIYMTLHLQTNCSLEQVPVYTMMTATSLVKAIEKLTQTRCQIKWVNDIYVNQKKIAGILIESLTASDPSVRNLLIGVGINFFLPHFPSDLQTKAGSLFQEQPSISRNQLISEMWQIFQNTAEEDLIKVYRDKSMVLDQKISFLENGILFEGIAVDITKKGELVVQLTNQEEKIISSNEISLSSWSS